MSSATVISGTINTIYGDGTADFRDALGSAARTSIGNVTAMAVDQRGNLYLQQSAPNLISKFDAETGNTCLITGRGPKNAIHSPEPGNAWDFSMVGLTAGTLALDLKGSLYFIDDDHASNRELRKIDLSSGSIRSLPRETGEKTWSIRESNSIEVNSQGALLLAAGCDNCAWKLNPDTGESHWLVRGGLGVGSGGHAPDVFSAQRLRIDSEGNVVLLHKSAKIVRLSQDGRAIPIAGNGREGESSGDGGPARAAAIDAMDIVIDHHGNIYLSEPDFNCIRRIDASTSIIRTVVGTCAYREKGAGFSGDGGEPSRAKLNAPTYLALDGDENLIFVDWGNHRVRKVVWGNLR